MATQRTARPTAAGSGLGELAEPVERIAALARELGTELGALAERLRGHRADDAAPGENTSDAGGGTMTGKSFATARPGGTAHAPLPGEPVDTSFAEPDPAARAAGEPEAPQPRRRPR